MINDLMAYQLEMHGAPESLPVSGHEPINVKSGDLIYADNGVNRFVGYVELATPTDVMGVDMITAATSGRIPYGDIKRVFDTPGEALEYINELNMAFLRERGFR